VLLNGIDVDAFVQREPLPPRPRRAVVFGNLAHELTFLPAIREACRRANLEVDMISAAAGTAITNPETILGNYDLAFAKAKCAMEAMACGLAVIVVGESGVGGLVRSGNFDRMRRLNFGIRTLQKPMTVETLLAELALYDAADARAVSDRIRRTASTADLHEALLSAYQSVICEHAATAIDPIEESRAAAAFLHDLAVRDRHREGTMFTLAKASQRVLRIPLVGPAATRALRWLIRRN